MSKGVPTKQPAGRYARLDHAELAWKGGRNASTGARPRLRARPVEARGRPRVRWRAVTSDPVLRIVWGPDDRHDTAQWETRSAQRAARQLSLRGDRQALPAHLDLFAVGAAQSLELRPVKTPGGRPEVELVHLRPILLVDLSCRKRSTGTATMSGGGCRSGAARTASATSGTAGGRSAGRPAGRRRYGVTSKRLLNGFSSGSFSQLEKPASCVSSLALAGGSPQVPSPAPPFASDVVMQ